MKLQARFVQLPLLFDADRLASEIAALPDSAWLPHPQRFAGNDFLPLISVNGEPHNESFAGPMAPTPYLEQCPYIVDVLHSLGASLGRTRLMRLSGGAEVTPHVDINYYWRDRMRVHVPIVTQPSVSFHCGGMVVNMAAGECWIFDTWSRHRVINDAERQRVHLVVDTVGGEGLWDLGLAGRMPEAPRPDWRPRAVAPYGASIAGLDFETQNVARVMTPWEVQNHISFLFGEALPDQPSTQPAVDAATHFSHVWRSLWSTFGEAEAGHARYRRVLDEFDARLRACNAHSIKLANGADLYMAMSTLVIAMALDGQSIAPIGEQRFDAGAGKAPSIAPGADPRFERPIFIVNPPRSGSSLLFETLAQAKDVYTIGGESHGLIEGVQGLGLFAHNFESNALDERDAKPEIVQTLRERFAQQLRDRDGKPAPPEGRVRMLEKTPKNALRVPFLKAAFPEACFIYLHRDPREVLASMMEAWESGRFQTYLNLPGWRGERPWSLLLTPGWRDLAALPLEQVVASQWNAATKAMLDSLETVPGDRWTVARYDALVADPNAEMRRLCAAFGLTWDRDLNPTLAHARHTVSAPGAGKWRARAAQVEAALPLIAEQAERAAKVAAR
jgi:hypothetical protein